MKLKTFFCSVLLGCVQYANAATLQLTYNGSFTTDDALNAAGDPTAAFSQNTAFTFTAIFSDTSPNLAPPFFYPHFVAYSPISAYLTVGGQKYRVTTAAEDAANGVAVALFDKNTFFDPGHYAVGFIQDVPADGAGIVGDFLSASTDYTAGSLVPTTWQDYVGTGYGSGPPLIPGNIAGPHEVRPIPLWLGADAYLLTLHNDERDGAPTDSASLTAVPEPASFGMAAGCLALLALRLRFVRAR